MLTTGPADLPVGGLLHPATRASLLDRCLDRHP